MDLPKVNVHQNGTHKASSEPGGAFAVDSQQGQQGRQQGVAQVQVSAQERVQKIQARQTVFPVDNLAQSPRTFLYNISRHTFSDIVLSRWLSLLLLLIGVVWYVGQLPLRWIMPTLCLFAIIVLVGAIHYWRKRDFVRFIEGALPTVSPEILLYEEKIPIHVTGYLTVENRGERYTWVPGFYRSFATREHALLCMVPDRQYIRIGRWSIGRWPFEQVGMWYAFFSAADITQIRWGQLRFDHSSRPALAIDHTVIVPARNRIQREKTITETLYIVCQQEEQAKRILADLQYDL